MDATRRRTAWVSGMIVCLIVIAAVTANAQPNIWKGTVSSNWFDAANWSLTNVPGAGEDVSIPSGKASGTL